MSIILPSPERASEIVTQWVPPALLVGGAAAGAKHLLGLMQQARKDEEIENAKRKDVLVVEIPQAAKTAAVNRAPRGVPNPAAGASAAAAAAPVSSSAANAAAATAAYEAPGLLKSIGAVPLAVGGLGLGATLLSATQGGDKTPPASSLGDHGLGILAGGTALLGGYGLVDSIIQARRKKNLEDQLNMAKSEYSRLLGQSLAKTASTGEAVEFPVLTGLCVELASGNFNKTADPLMNVANIPLASAAISALFAHKWMYDRQKELEALHTTKKPAPPKQIQFVTAKSPDELEEDPAAKVASDIGVPSILDVFSSPQSETKVVLQKEDDDKKIKQPTATVVAPGVIQISTESGPVEMQAQDPAAAKILTKASPRLTKLLAAFQSTPAELVA